MAEYLSQADMEEALDEVKAENAALRQRLSEAEEQVRLLESCRIKALRALLAESNKQEEGPDETNRPED